MLRFWGDGSREAMDLVNAIRVRSTENFNWTFIFILSVVFYIYWNEIRKKNTETVCAGLALYGVHWLYEICNAVIGKVCPGVHTSERFDHRSCIFGRERFRVTVASPGKNPQRPVQA